MAGAVEYHYGKFPPTAFDLATLLRPLTAATAALARYDQTLKGMHNSELLLAPLRKQEAVISSRMEGTISTLDEVLRFEAEDENGAVEGATRSEAVEVALYSRAMRYAQESMKDGRPLNDWLIRSAHRMLLGYGRGSRMGPGEYKTEQNYLGDRGRNKIMFVPISPEKLPEGMERLHAFIGDPDVDPLIKAAVSHLEFEALHPFKDGNGRIGRMLVPLILWKDQVLAEPHFYVSAFFEEYREAYIDQMRMVSASGDWTPWIVFFLQALERQAQRNLATADDIRSLYERMKTEFRSAFASQWSGTALDFVFTRPVFRSNTFTARSGIPAATANRCIKALLDSKLLTTIEPPAGRRAGMYAFEPLLELVRS